MRDDGDLNPQDRARRPDVAGTPLELGGFTWLLLDHIPDVGGGAVWDRLYDGNVYRRSYEPSDLRLGAYRLLFANYWLTPDEALGLLRGADPQSLVPAVEVALCGYANPLRTHSEWVLSALVANGIDPAKVPPNLVREVMAQLVGTGRAVPQDKFITSAIHAKKRSRMLGMGR